MPGEEHHHIRRQAPYVVVGVPDVPRKSVQGSAPQPLGVRAPPSARSGDGDPGDLLLLHPDPESPLRRSVQPLHQVSLVVQVPHQQQPAVPGEVGVISAAVNGGGGLGTLHSLGASWLELMGVCQPPFSKSARHRCYLPPAPPSCPYPVLRVCEIKSGRPGGTRTRDLSFIRALRCRSEQSCGEFGWPASTDYATDYLC